VLTFEKYVTIFLKFNLPKHRSNPRYEGHWLILEEIYLLINPFVHFNCELHSNLLRKEFLERSDIYSLLLVLKSDQFSYFFIQIWSDCELLVYLLESV